MLLAEKQGIERQKWIRRDLNPHDRGKSPARYQLRHGSKDWWGREDLHPLLKGKSQLRCSLRYSPKKVPPEGFEPPPNRVKAGHAANYATEANEWHRAGSNCRPPLFQSGALPTELPCQEK